jgi:hypothetical protein
MAVNYGPSLITSGLVLLLDAANPRSYPGSGTLWTDIISGTSGTITRAAYSTGNLGYFAMSPASTSRVDYNPAPAMLNITNNISLEAWVYPNSYVLYGGIITYGTGSAEQYSLGTNTTSGGCFAFSCNYPAAWTFFYAPSTPTGAWYHVMATFASGACNFYINGALAATGTISQSSLTAVSGAYLVIGDNHPGGQEYFDGNISVCRIYNRVLSIVELQQNFNAQRGRYGI